MAREQRNLSIRDVANSINIRSDHIEAMEAEDWGVFGARVYAKGFVRTYAQHLKLEVPALMRRMDEQLKRASEEEGIFFESGSSGSPRNEPPRPGLRHGPLDALMLQVSRIQWSLALFILGGLLLLWIGWRVVESRRHPKPDPVLPPALYRGPVPNAPVVIPLPTNPPARRGGS
jgi:cytoskeletal protein RodZ